MSAGRIWLASLATIAALIVLWVSTDLFLLAALVTALVWAAILRTQRDEARAERDHLEDEADTLAATVRSDAALVLELDAENTRLHLELTEAQIAAGTVRVPLLRSVPTQRDEMDDSWLELLVTRPKPFGDVS